MLTARQRLAGLPATVVQTNFRYAADALASVGVEAIDGALLDLGVSATSWTTRSGAFLTGPTRRWICG